MHKLVRKVNREKYPTFGIEFWELGYKWHDWVSVTVFYLKSEVLLDRDMLGTVNCEVLFDLLSFDRRWLILFDRLIFDIDNASKLHIVDSLSATFSNLSLKSSVVSDSLTLFSGLQLNIKSIDWCNKWMNTGRIEKCRHYIGVHFFLSIWTVKCHFLKCNLANP